MNSAITITQYKDKLTGSCEGRKVAKLFQDKVNVMSDTYYNQLVSGLKNEFEPTHAKITDMFNLSYSSLAVDENDKLLSARKLKINNPTNLFNNSYEEYNKSVESDVITKRNNAKADKTYVDNVVPFPSIKMEEKKEVENAPVYTNNVVEFPKERVAFRNETSSSLNNDTANNVSNNSNNTLSRLSRIDYNASSMSNSFEKNETPVRDNTVSIDDYLQHGKIKSNDHDLKVLMENNKRLNSEINESQRVLEQLEAQLSKLKEISEAKRQARINELEEENLSKTATLNGLTEQIKALQEAIKLEQQSVNEGSIRRVA